MKEHSNRHGIVDVKGEKYFPEDMPEGNYYRPVSRGLEIKIKEKLDYLRRLDCCL